MASPSPDLDIEAQTNNSTVTWPEINLESPPSTNPQLSTTPEPPVQHTARKITDNSRVERGILTSFFGFTSVISFLSQTRNMETLLMSSG